MSAELTGIMFTAAVAIGVVAATMVLAITFLWALEKISPDTSPRTSFIRDFMIHNEYPGVEFTGQRAEDMWTEFQKRCGGGG